MRSDPGESSSSIAQVMAPTRMKLRVRRRGNAAAAGDGDGQAEEEERRRRESGARSSRRKNTNNTSATPNATTTASSSPPPLPLASARAPAAAEEASPDSKCPICLDRFNNLAYLDRCLHRFCFPCIQEWSHNKAECPLCKQPFASILHSVVAEDDFKEYTLRPPPANSSVAATVAMVAAMASAARSDHQMRLMLRRHRGADGEAAVGGATRRRRRERGGAGGRRGGGGVWEWYLDPPPAPAMPRHHAVSPVVDSEDGEELEEARTSPRPRGADLTERGVIFEGLTGLSGAVAPIATSDRASRRLMTRLAARQRLQREGGAVRALRERETLAFRRALYRSAVRVRGVAGNQGQQQRDITAESFRRNPSQLHRLRPWLRRELTVLYGAHGTLVDIVQRIITARLARHGLEDTPTVEEELRPFLLARTDHFLHELVSFARSPLSLESYDLQAVYEPSAAAVQLDASDGSDSSSVIAISEGEDDDERPTAQDDVMQTGSCLSLAAWDDETPGPSYTTAGAEPPCSLAGEPPLGAATEDECLIVGYKKPIAERTPELVQLSSDSEEDEEKTEEKLPPLAFLPTIPPCTSRACSSSCREEPDDGCQENSGEGCGELRLSVSSGAGSSGAGTPAESETTARRRDRKSSGAARKKKRKKRRRERKSGTLSNPNRSIFPAMIRRGRQGRRRSPCLSGGDDSSPDSSWELSPLSSSVSSSSSSCSSSSSSSSSSSPPAPSLSPGNHHHGEKPGGKRKYKSRHLDSVAADPTWRPSRKSGGSRKRRSRAERSPSVEIIYEGTVFGNAASPPAAKRRRKPRRHARLSSSPVIITLDSDSSHDDDAGGDDTNNPPSGGGSVSSSPLSSQQTVDFSDLPPLPPLHSHGAVDADVARLPVRILDRQSDGDDGSDGSDVDVENVGSPPGSHDGDNEAPRGDMKAADQRDAAAASVSPVRRKDSDVPKSDSSLLATILDDLEGITAPKRDAPFNFEPRTSNRETNVFAGERRGADAVGERDRGVDSPLRRASIRPPPLERPKDCGSGEDAQDLPPRPYDRNTLPPLKHKDADFNSNGRKLRSPCSVSSELTAALGGELSPVNVRPRDPDPPAGIPPIISIPIFSTLERHFATALAPRAEPASAGGVSANDAHSLARFAPINHPNAPSRVATLSSSTPKPSHKPPADYRSSSASESSSASVDIFSRLAFDSSKKEELASSSSSSGSLSPVGFHAAKTGAESEGLTRDNNVRSSSSVFRPFDGRLESSSASVDIFSHLKKDEHVGRDGAKELFSSSSGSLSPVGFQADSTSAGRGNQTSSERPLADIGAILSGVYLNNVSSVDPSPSRSFSPRENSAERFSRSKAPTPAPSGAALPFNATPPRRPESLTPANHGEPEVRSSGSAVYPFDGRLNHAAFETSRKKGRCRSDSPGESDLRLPGLADSRVKPKNHFDAGYGTPFGGSERILPAASQPKDSRRDLQLPADNHESRRDSSSSGSDLERNVWDTHTHTAT